MQKLRQYLIPGPAAASLTLLAFSFFFVLAARGQEPPDDLPRILPPTIVEVDPLAEPAAIAPPSPPAPVVSPFDLPNSFPNLSQQVFAGDGSIYRFDKSVFDAPAMATIIDSIDLQERMPQDMFQAIEREVGVMVQRTANGQAAPYIRGLTGQQVLILVDGIRLNNSTFRAGPNQYFNLIDPGQVERIEVVRGPGSVLYGSDAIGGTINIVTRGADGQRGNYGGVSFNEYFSTADLGSYSRGNIEGWVGQTGLFTGASFLNVNNIDRGGDLGRQPFTDYQQYAGDVKINRLLADDLMLTIGLQHFEQENVPRSDRFFPFVATPRPTFFDPQQRDLAYLRLSGREVDGPISSYMFTASYGRQKEGSRQLQGNNLDVSEFDVGTTGLNAVLSSELDFAGALHYGVDWYHDHVEAEAFRYNNATGALVGPRTPQFPPGSYYERTGVFLMWDVWLTERLNLLTGVRYEHIDLGSTPIVRFDPPGGGGPVDVPVRIDPSYSDWVGSGALTYELNDYTHLVGSISEGFRAPNLDDLVATNTLVQQAGLDLPSIDLGPERSINYELGLKFNTPRLRTQAFVFWMDLRDNILRAPVAVGTFQRTNRNSYLQGVEWTGEYLFEGGYSLYGNFSYYYGRDRVFDEPLSRVPPMQGILGARWRDRDHRRWIDCYAWLVDRADRLNFQDFTDARIPVGGTPGFQTVNVRVGTTLGERRNHTLSLALENIFDQAYRVHGSGVDGPGINAILGYTLRR